MVRLVEVVEVGTARAVWVLPVQPVRATLAVTALILVSAAAVVALGQPEQTRTERHLSLGLAAAARQAQSLAPLSGMRVVVVVVQTFASRLLRVLLLTAAALLRLLVTLELTALTGAAAAAAGVA
jgi:hypothetical protein